MYTKTQLVAFGNYLLSQGRKGRIMTNLRGVKTGNKKAEDIGRVTHADIQHFDQMSDGSTERRI